MRQKRAEAGIYFYTHLDLVKGISNLGYPCDYKPFSVEAQGDKVNISRSSQLSEHLQYTVQIQWIEGLIAS